MAPWAVGDKWPCLALSEVQWERFLSQQVSHVQCASLARQQCLLYSVPQLWSPNRSAVF